jgi:putative Mg2+ transporter-C (MgtC) family protein
MNLLECFYRLLAAFVLGSIIGYERQRRSHVSGLRTTVLVSLGTALFCIPVESLNHADPSRVPAGVVSGIGFLCASYIFKEGQQVTGLATAATIFSAGAIGTLCGLGYWTYAAIGTIFILFTNLVLKKVK